MSAQPRRRVPAGPGGAGSPPLPPEDVLGSGAVLFPGVFDQHGCPLVVFPPDGQDRLSDLCSAEVVDFITYFQVLHRKNEEKQVLVSAVADLRHATLPTARLIAQTLLLLEQQGRAVHSVYIIQPKKKEVLKQLVRLLDPPKSHRASFRIVLLKEIPELFNYIDRSQLPQSLGGYYRYCHQSWVDFIKEINAFVQDFLSVVERFPASVSRLQAWAQRELPSSIPDLQHFCSTNQDQFLKLRRDLGLDELLKRCENVVEKLRHPEKDPCYQAMAGTCLFTHTVFDMLQKHSRIVAAVEKLELLWQQAFRKAHVQLEVLQLRSDGLQITEKIERLQQKLLLYRIEIAKDRAQAEALLSDFEASIHTPAMGLVCWAEDVIHTLAEILPLEAQIREAWALDLERLVENLQSTVQYILHTLRAVSCYHHYYNKAHSWYRLVLGENLQELLAGAGIPARRWRLSLFLQKNPPPDVEELLHLAHLSTAIPDHEPQQMGMQISQRCTALRKLLMSPGPVSAELLQLSLQWQNEKFHNHPVYHGSQSAEKETTKAETHDPSPLNPSEGEWRLEEDLPASPGKVSAEGKPPSLSPLDSRSSKLEVCGRKDGGQGLLTGSENSMTHNWRHHQICHVSCNSHCKGHKEQSSIQPVEKSSDVQISGQVDTVKLELKVAGFPRNPWLSVPVNHVEESHTVSIEKNSVAQKRDLVCPDASEPHAAVSLSTSYQDEPPQMDVMRNRESREPPSMDWTLNSQSGFHDPDLSPICNILSSTITDEMDESTSTSEGLPTLLWDSYDLHDEEPDAIVGVRPLAVKDWDVKEQQGLQEVENILGRIDEILEEEENVLAQQTALDDLLRSEVRDLWPPWDTEDHSAVMWSSESADAGVLGFEDCLSAGEPGPDEACAGELSMDPAAGGRPRRRPEPMTELRNVPILNELMVEESLESLELQKLQLCREGHSHEGSGKPLLDKQPFVKEEEGEAHGLLGGKEERKEEKCEMCVDRNSVLENSSYEGGDVLGCSVEGNELFPQSGHLRPLAMNNSQDGTCTETCRDAGEADRTRRSTGNQPSEEAILHNQRVSLDQCGGLADSCNKAPAPGSPGLRRDEAFDPEGTPPGPPEPSKSSHLVNSSGVEVNTPHSPEVCDPGPCCVAQGVHEPQAPPDHSEDSVSPEVEPCNDNNNNNNHTLPSQNLAGSTCKEVRLSHSGSAGMQAPPHGNGREAADFRTPIVLDTGSGLMKAGFADQEHPHVIFPTIIGMPKYEEVMNSSLERETYIGHDAQLMRGVLALRHPIKNGIIRNWDEMEKIWHHAFQQLGVDPEDHPVLLTEAAMNPLENRQRMVELMFEGFHVPLVYVAMQAVLALHATGRTTGVVLDSGDGVSHCVPVFEGYCLGHAVQRFPLAGGDVTMHLQKLLQEQGVSLRTTAEREIVRDMKESCCFVALDYGDALSGGSSSCREIHYSMPDGQVVSLLTERFRAPEILFEPRLVGCEHSGLQQSVLRAVLGSDLDLRRSLLENIVLSGGNTLLPGLTERLQAEVEGLVPADTGVRVRVTSPKDRDFLVWRGGAVLASLPSFSSAWISQEEYEEFGPQIVFRRCF
ncbi:uncharacterized protein ACNS7B_002718 [Menidia menidia]